MDVNRLGGEGADILRYFSQVNLGNLVNGSSQVCAGFPRTFNRYIMSFQGGVY